MDAVVDRIDIGAIVDRVDVNEVVQRVDVDAVVEQTELGTIVARSTSGFASEALDAARTQAVDVDDIVTRVVNRVMRRRQEDLPLGPGRSPARGPAGDEEPRAVTPGEPRRRPGARAPGPLRRAGDAAARLPRRRRDRLDPLHGGRSR